ncbi:MAG: SDR family NAD(P)-dependent oxidoreductase [Candidatus Wallbacteria bacterium]|nr:SDR family NAD(P)-dependent oxidoreductase [Candidatus Wallbacteria bacterium]
MAEHVLVIGGTGMLKDACLELAARGYVVSVVGRDTGRLEAMMMDASAAGNMLSPLEVDYFRTDAFTQAVRHAVELFGPIDAVVAWVRSDAREVLPATMREVSAAGRSWRLFEVLGTASKDAETPRSQPDLSPAGGLCAYREIVLGFVPQPGGARWLETSEICEGVLDAVTSDRSTVVGTVEPSEARPR